MVCAAIAGCGGGGGEYVEAFNPFQGAWEGTWTRSDGQFGQASVAIAKKGAVNGQLRNHVSGGSTNLKGRVNLAGVFTGELSGFLISPTDATGNFVVAGPKLTADIVHGEGDDQTTTHLELSGGPF